MKRVPLISFLLPLFLVACGPGPEPENLLGEEQASAVVSTFLRSLQSGDDEKAKALTAKRPDRTIGDLDHCRELFFSERPTGMSVLQQGREIYGSSWHLFVDVKINYGSQMKQLHFILEPEEVPKVRSVTPIIPR